jgi:hypothetical protein
VDNVADEPGNTDLPHFYSWQDFLLKSMTCLHSIGLAHNLIHTSCAEVAGAAVGVLGCLPVVLPALYLRMGKIAL